MNKEFSSLLKPSNFKAESLRIFTYQYHNNPIYNTFCKHLKKHPENVHSIEDIPFLPIQFFKSHRILSNKSPIQEIFTSSGTTGTTTSKHYVTNLALYQASFTLGFTEFYGTIDEYMVIGLLPSYLERKGSSLVYMVNDFIQRSKYAESGFFLNDVEKLKNLLLNYDGHRKILLIGVSFALLDLVEAFQFKLKSTIVMETGGMKGRRKEMIREELHNILKAGFGVSHIHSEYGMTELLSQAYSKGSGIFSCPASMQILIRNTENPQQILNDYTTGGINVIDLANFNSISFIATQDLGKKVGANQFEILGRFDHSDIRGCNLMVL